MTTNKPKAIVTKFLQNNAESSQSLTFSFRGRSLYHYNHNKNLQTDTESDVVKTLDYEEILCDSPTNISNRNQKATSYRGADLFNLNNESVDDLLEDVTKLYTKQAETITAPVIPQIVSNSHVTPYPGSKERIPLKRSNSSMIRVTTNTKDGLKSIDINYGMKKGFQKAEEDHVEKSFIEKGRQESTLSKTLKKSKSACVSGSYLKLCIVSYQRLSFNAIRSNHILER